VGKTLIPQAPVHQPNVGNGQSRGFAAQTQKQFPRMMERN